MVATPCPTCRNVATRGQPDWPFCSDRCRLVDLGRWLDGAFRIPGDPVSTDELGERGAGGGGRSRGDGEGEGGRGGR